MFHIHFIRFDWFVTSYMGELGCFSSVIVLFFFTIILLLLLIKGKGEHKHISDKVRTVSFVTKNKKKNDRLCIKTEY